MLRFPRISNCRLDSRQSGVFSTEHFWGGGAHCAPNLTKNSETLQNHFSCGSATISLAEAGSVREEPRYEALPGCWLGRVRCQRVRRHEDDVRPSLLRRHLS